MALRTKHPALSGTARGVMPSMLLGLALAAGTANAGTVIIETSGMVQRDGAIAEGAAVAVERGKISGMLLESDDRDEDAETHAYPAGSVLSPGLIDLGSTLGINGENTSTFGPIDPEPMVIDAFDPRAREIGEALEAGITAVMLIPTPNGVVRGRTATVGTAAAPGSDSQTLVADGPLLMVVGEPSADTLYGPTSRAGAMFALRQAMGEAKAGRSDSAALAEMVDGKRGAVVLAPAADDAAMAMQTMFGAGLDGFALLTLEGTLELSMNLKAFGVDDGSVSFITGPYSPGDAPDALAGAGGLERAGVPVALRGGTGGNPAGTLRMTAALATRYGMSADAARRAITIEPARIAGIERTRGSIERGKTADLVVWSADPLRPDARVLAVYMNGELVLGGPSDTVAGRTGKGDAR